MKIVLLPHARQRMRERNIPVAVVHAVVLHPDKIAFDPKNHNRYIARKIITLDRRRLLILVVYGQTKKAIEIITVITTSKIYKYL